MTLADYQESITGAVSLYPNTTNHSTDNGVLFTCVAYQLGLLDLATLESICFKYFYLPSSSDENCILRYPSNPNFMSWDDHLALYSSSPRAKDLIHRYMLRHFFFLPDGNWLGRFVGLTGLVIPLLSLLAAIGYIVNLFSATSNTSGRQLLWLSGRWFWNHWLPMRPILWFWRWMMLKRYPNGLKDLFAIYYTDPNHPFHSAAPSNFD